MSDPINMRKNRVICDCAECGDLVDISPYSNKEEYQADYACFACGKIVCDSCYGDMERYCYGDPRDEDHQSVCADCVAKYEDKLSLSSKGKP